MKVLMVGRGTLFSRLGGDTIQMLKTAEYLNKIDGVQVDMKTVDDSVDFIKYDFLHLFNITRPSDMMGVIKKAKLPYIISTVYIDYSEAEANHYKKSRRFLSKIFSVDQLEYIKILARVFKGQEKISDYNYLFFGQKNSIKNLIKGASLLLPNSLNEYKRLIKSYGVVQKYKVIPNAVDTNIFNRVDTTQGKYDKFKNAVISVGQITPVKNHLNLIKALNNTKYKVYIIGAPSLNAIDYYEKCKKIAANNIYFISYVKQEELAEIYKSAKVHVLTSWFETTGLVSLEAAYSGCNVVITNRGDQVEYFKEGAFYCEPDDKTSILKAVDDAFNSIFKVEIKERIVLNYTWDLAAKKTLEGYKSVFKP